MRRPDAPASADAPTGPLPRTIDLDRPAAGDEELFDQAAHHEPPLPLQLVEPVAARSGKPRGDSASRRVATHEDETEEQKAARARIPSWDDILLGVRRKRD